MLVADATVKAFIGSENVSTPSNTSIESKGPLGLRVIATQTANVIIVTVGGSGGSTAGIAGSVSVNDFQHVTWAWIGGATTINAVNTGAAATQGVAVTATDTTTIVTAAGALAIGGSAGIGAGVDVNVVDKDTQAWIGGAGTLTVRGHVTVDATSSEDVTTISVGGGFSGTAAVTVNVGVPVIDITTKAHIDGGPNAADGATSTPAAASA